MTKWCVKECVKAAGPGGGREGAGRGPGGGREGAGRGPGGAGYRIKNKNPTQRCGE